MTMDILNTWIRELFLNYWQYLAVSGVSFIVGFMLG